MAILGRSRNNGTNYTKSTGERFFLFFQGLKPLQKALCQDKQLAIGRLDLKQGFERKVEDMAENHPDHTGMGDNERFFFSPGQRIEKGQDPVREVLETFTT